MSLLNEGYPKKLNAKNKKVPQNTQFDKLSAPKGHRRFNICFLKENSSLRFLRY